MAFFDNSLLLSNAQAITTTAASTSVYDITGAGVGNAPSMVFGINPSTGAATLPGADIGTGDGMAVPVAFFTVTTTGTGAGTISFAVEAAPGLSNNNEGTYTVLATSAAYTGTTLLKGNQIILPIPPFAQIAPGMGTPRFYKFLYTVSGSATVSVTAGILLNPPAGYVSTQYPPNYISV